MLYLFGVGFLLFLIHSLQKVDKFLNEKGTSSWNPQTCKSDLWCFCTLYVYFNHHITVYTVSTQLHTDVVHTI